MNRETQNGLWARIERVRRNLTSDEARLEQILEQSVQAEEKPTPKFKIGDKVKILIENWSGKRIAEIFDYDKSDDTYKLINCQANGLKTDLGLWVKDFQIAPYTEPEPKQNEDDMEEKELNLLTLLKGCEGEKFYSPNYGEIELNEIDGLGSRPLKWQRKENFFHTFSDGRIYSDSEPTIFPSRDLFLKYPLESAKAWQIWKSERTPKRWRAKLGEHYYRFDSMFGSVMEMENGGSVDNTYYGHGNYFQTRKEAEQAAEAVKRTLEEFHENNDEK